MRTAEGEGWGELLGGLLRSSCRERARERACVERGREADAFHGGGEPALPRVPKVVA